MGEEDAPEKIRDKIGQEIVVGAYIAYGHALGRCAALRIGRVLKLSSEQKPHLWRDEPVTEYRITVQGVDDDGSYHEPRLTERKGTLLYPNRILVLDREKLPVIYTGLLEPVVKDE